MYIELEGRTGFGLRSHTYKEGPASHVQQVVLFVQYFIPRVPQLSSVYAVNVPKLSK